MWKRRYKMWNYLSDNIHHIRKANNKPEIDLNRFQVK